METPLQEIQMKQYYILTVKINSYFVTVEIDTIITILADFMKFSLKNIWFY